MSKVIFSKTAAEYVVANQKRICQERMEAIANDWPTVWDKIHEAIENGKFYVGKFAVPSKQRQEFYDMLTYYGYTVVQRDGSASEVWIK